MLIILSCKEDEDLYRKVIGYLSKNGIPHLPKDNNISSVLQDHRILIEYCQQPNVLIPIFTKQSISNEAVVDFISLAYLTDIQILPLVIGCKIKDIRSKLNSGLLLMLCSIQWGVIKNMDSFDNIMLEITDTLDNTTFEIDCSINKVGQRRLSYLEINDFWETSFGESTEVAWVEFKQTFCNNYSAMLAKDFDQLRQNWLMNCVIFDDIFNCKDPVQKSNYDLFMSKSKSNNFYKMLLEYSAAKLAMTEVFSMESTVRLDAIRRMGMFNTKWIVNELCLMLKNSDPNIRGISCLALSQCSLKNDKLTNKVTKHLEELLNSSDLIKDRLVRECLVIVFGKLKLEQTIPFLLQTWRSDPIKDVREAALAALKNIGGSQVKDALDITAKVDKEIQSLNVQI